MKRILALVFTTLTIAGGAAPAFAATAMQHPAYGNTSVQHLAYAHTAMQHPARQPENNCVFKDKSLCEVKSLSPTVNNDG